MEHLVYRRTRKLAALLKKEHGTRGFGPVARWTLKYELTFAYNNPGLFFLLVLSRKSELAAVRTFLSFLIGLLVGLIFHWSLGHRLGLNLSSTSLNPEGSALAIRLFFMLLTGVLFIISPTFRCIFSLTIPTFIGRNLRNLFLSYLFFECVKTPGHIISHNFGALKQSFACHAQTESELGADLTKYRIDVTLKTIDALQETYNGVNKTTLNTYRRLADSALTPQSVTDIPEDELVEMCFNNTQEVYDICRDHIETPVLEKCDEETRWYLKFAISCQEVGEKLARCDETRKKMLNDCNNVKAKNAEKKEVEESIASLKAMSADYEGLQGGLDSPNLVERPEPGVAFTPLDIAAGINNKLDIANDAGNFMVRLLRLLLNVIFIFIIYSSTKYHNRFLRDIDYDNQYIDEYFRWIDCRRALKRDKQKTQEEKKKITTLMPLKQYELAQVVSPFEFRLTRSESGRLKQSTLLFITLAFFIGVILFITYYIQVFVDSLGRHTREITYQMHTGEKVDIHVTGNGTIARKIKDNILETLNYEFPNTTEIASAERCAPEAIQMSASQWLYIAALFIVAWLLDFIEILALRLRHVIGAWYYPKLAKRRTLYLYNLMLERRDKLWSTARSNIGHNAEEEHESHMYDAIHAMYKYCPNIVLCIPLRWLLSYLLNSLRHSYCSICTEELHYVERESGGVKTVTTYQKLSTEEDGRGSDGKVVEGGVCLKCGKQYCSDCWNRLGHSCLNEDCTSAENTSDEGQEELRASLLEENSDN